MLKKIKENKWNKRNCIINSAQRYNICKNSGIIFKYSMKTAFSKAKKKKKNVASNSRNTF